MKIRQLLETKKDKTEKKKIAWNHQEAKLKTWSRWGHIERPDNFFSNIDFFVFNFQYKKLHWYKIHMNNQL